MQVIILAGGLGTRMRSVAPDLPKSLIPVAGRPFIEHQFDLLRRWGLTNILLCIGDKGEKIEQHVGDGSRFGVHVQYSREDPKNLLGTGGALVNAMSQGFLDDEFLVMYGDSYLPTNYCAIVRAWRERNVTAMMCVYRNEGRWDASNVRIRDGWVVFYSKRAQPGEADYIDYGLSAFRRIVLEPYRGYKMPLDLAVIQEDLVRAHALAAYEVSERFFEIGKPSGWQELNEWLAKRERNESIGR